MHYIADFILIQRNTMETKEVKDTDQKLLSRKEAAKYLGCTAGTLAIWKCTKRYSLPYVRIGRNIRYKLSDLIDFINNNVSS